MKDSMRVDSIRRLWWQAAEKEAPEKSSPLFLVFIALCGLTAFDVLGFGVNFDKLRCRVTKWPLAPRRRLNVSDACRAINYACVWYPKRVQCLQRSAVVTCLLRSGGVPAEMVMGAQSLPFKAHAWTEVDGRAINERRDVQRIYDVLDRW